MFEDNDDTPVTLTINKVYANKYGTWREKEEKQKLIARYGSDIEDESDEESEDDNAEEWTDDVEKEFLRCYSILKKRDPKIYDPNTTFFNTMSTSSTSTSEDNVKTKKKEKKMNLKDAEIQYALAESMNNDGDADDIDQVKRNNGKKSIIEEQEEIKRSFKNALETNDDDNEDFFRKKVKTELEKAKEEEEYIQWLKGQKNEITDPNIKSDLKYLHDYWNDPSLSERDRFLRDFILNKMHLQNNNIDDDDETKIPSYDEIINEAEEDDDDEFEKAEEFERKFNFRYQEPDQEFLKQYPRTINDSVRRKDDRRKLKRLEKKQRKELERKQKEEEIKRLKNLKKKEILDKIQRLKSISGDEALPIKAFDLDGDFDPKEYDRRMQELFNDDYYGKGNDEEEIPEVSDEELQVENWDYKNEELPKTEKKDKGENQQQDQPNKKSKKKSKLSQAIAQSKPVFDPKEKSFEQYFDEYYKLDCEDFISDMPVRFQYRQVEPNSFGLTIDEILVADDRELNAWCSLKKTSQYRSKEEEYHDLHVYRNKAKYLDKKKKILTSVYKEKDEQDESELRDEQTTNTDVNPAPEPTTKTKNKKRKSKQLSNEQRVLTDMPDERLQAYGLNPKRFRNFVCFNKDKKQ